MPKRSRTPKKDANRAAFDVLQSVIQQTKGMEKNPLAVALGRRGGLKGGKSRAANMTAAERSESARMAADARWRRHKDKEPDA